MRKVSLLVEVGLPDWRGTSIESNLLLENLQPSYHPSSAQIRTVTKNALWASLGVRRDVYQSVGEERQELRVDRGVEDQHAALLSSLFRVARSQSPLLVADLHLDGKFLIIIALLSFLSLHLSAALPDSL